MPDFAQVYSFLGSVFDPSTKGHLQKLKEMNPIDVETVCELLIYLIFLLVFIQKSTVRIDEYLCNVVLQNFSSKIIASVKSKVKAA
jgi:hypothetical protein